jgi:hypothetical protein
VNEGVGDLECEDAENLRARGQRGGVLGLVSGGRLTRNHRIQPRPTVALPRLRKFSAAIHNASCTVGLTRSIARRRPGRMRRLR